MNKVLDRINLIHQRPLHDGQIELARAYFIDKKKVILSQWGRSAGKTEAVLYIAWVKALLDPGSEIYIICPERDQGEKIYWKSRRLQEYGPPEYIAQERASDLTMVFNNSSYIVIEGAKNAKSLRGIKPTLVFYDELQDHGEEFDKEVMRPNLLGRGCSLIATGTPPKMECYYTQFKKRVMEAIRDGDKTRAYFQFPNTINAGLNKEEINKEIAALIAQGDEAIVKREYYGEDCYGGKDAVFPLWDRQKHIKRHGLLLLTCFTARAHTKWLVVCDPANHSCFAVLFCVHNPITSEFYVLDEIYQTDRKKTDATSMWGQIQDKVKELNPDQKWHYIYDEREAWFAREISANFHVQMTPTKKQKKGSGEEAGINAMKMLMRAESAFHVSDKCYWFTWEIQNYVTDEHGQLVDRHNHLLDCCRYALNYCGFSFVEKTERTGQKALRLGGEVVGVKNTLKTAEDWSEEMVEASLGAGSWERDYF